jgi:hypothetical protein
VVFSASGPHSERFATFGPVFRLPVKKPRSAENGKIEA